MGELAAVRDRQAPGTAGAALSAQTRRLLDGPVTPTLLRLAAPNVLVMMLQAAVSTLDAVFVGWLGSEALAGVSLVFPPVMLMADHVGRRLCPCCGSRMRLIATVNDPRVIRQILAHLGLARSGQSPGPAPPEPSTAP